MSTESKQLFNTKGPYYVFLVIFTVNAYMELRGLSEKHHATHVPGYTYSVLQMVGGLFVAGLVASLFRTTSILLEKFILALAETLALLFAVVIAARILRPDSEPTLIAWTSIILGVLIAILITVRVIQVSMTSDRPK
jgi:uncharacterized membrane protein YiaA